MRRPRTSPAELYRLVMNCRQSGLSDVRWCEENGIQPSTFYNWVTRLGKRDVKFHRLPAKKIFFHQHIKGIPVEEVIVDISDDDKICPQCGTELELIGRETIRHEIEYIPAKVKVKNMLVYTIVVLNVKKRKNHIL